MNTSNGISKYAQRNHIWIAFAFVFTILASLVTTAKAQSDVTISILIVPPPSPQLSVWRSDPSRIRVTLLNNTATSLRLRLSGHADNGGGVTLSTKDDYPVPVIVLDPHATRTLGGNELSIFSTGAVNFSGTDAATLERTGMLPEGTYTICMRAMDYDAPHTFRSTDQCAPFNITYVDPPRTMQPMCDQTIATIDPQVLLFSWTQPMPPTSAIINYNFVLVEVPDGRQPQAAIDARTTPAFFEHTFINQTTFTYSPTEPHLIPGRRYAWRVQAVDPSHSLAIRNQGNSEACSFVWGAATASGSCANPTITAAYPPPGSRVPYRYTPVIIRFDPYCETYHRFLSDFTPTGGSLEHRDLEWTPTPLDAQRRAVGSITQEQAQYIWIGTHGGVPYTPGERHDWNGSVSLTGTPHTINSDFSVGMGPSQLRLPADNSTVSPGADIDFQWHTANSPGVDAVKPRYDVRQSTSTGTSSYSLNASERWVLEVSRSRDITDPVWTTNGTVSIAADGVDVSTVVAALYKDLDAHHSFTELGDYYWRVKWMTDATDASSTASYEHSDVFHFAIGTGGSVPLTACISITPASPTIGGTWTAGLNPRFSVLVHDGINTDAITGGHLQVWDRASATEDAATTIGRTPVFDQSFTGHATTSIRAHAGTPGEFDLSFVNETGSAQTFTAVNTHRYLWRFTMTFDGASIRSDHLACSLTSVASSDGLFVVDNGTSAGPADCHDDCSAPEVPDHTAVSTTFTAGHDLHLGKFTLHLIAPTGTGEHLSGTGSVRIDFLNNISVAVDLSDLQVNAGDQVFGGTVHTHWGGTSPLPSLGGVGNALGLTQAQIADVWQAASQPSRLVSQLVAGTPISLPFGIDTSVGGQRIVIGVIGLDFTSHNAQLNAAVSIPLPFLGPGIGVGLGARNICLSPSGLGGDGYAKLYLPADIGYRQDDPNTWGFVFKGTQTDETHTITDEGTYVSWSCHGFESFRIAADITFPRSWLVPILTTGLVDNDASHRVTASFTTLVSRRTLESGHASWGWMAEATMGRFAPSSTPELIMTVDSLAIDQSDDANPSSITFPAGYAGAHDNTWRGFYMHRLSCALPQQLRTFGDGQPIQVAIQNFLIDNTGLSGSFRVENVVMYPRANFGEWGASIDTIGCDIVSSSFRSAYMNGRFKIPISDSALLYRAMLTHPSTGFLFTFTIQPKDTINAKLWVAKLHLDPTSHIDLTAGGGGGFNASATLNGMFTLAGNVNNPGGGGGMSGMNFRGLRFEGLILSTASPYITPGTWPLASEQHGAAGFPVTLSDIGIVAGDRGGHPGIGLQFHVALTLQSGSNGVSGGTTISVWGVMAPDASSMTDHAGAQSFRFDGINCDAINLAVDLGTAAHISGTIALYNNDAVFGSGFMGSVSARFIQKIDVAASVRFGSVMSGRDTNRYWYVDANVGLPSGIPFMTGFAFWGFGGGAWYHMRRTGELGAAPTGGSGGQANQFVPDRTVGFGLRAKAVIGTFPANDVFNADITLELQFLAGGGIGRISLLGDGYLLAGIQSRANAPVAVHVGIGYDFPTTTLHGRMSVAIMSPYNLVIDVLNHDSVIVFHVDPATWYFHMGTPPPSQRVGLSVGLGPAPRITFRTYLCAGHDIPTPELPTEITSRLPGLRFDRNDAMSMGSGFAFGASLDVNTGRQQFLIFYGELRLLVGFDLAMLNYGTTAHCAETGQPMGMQGWYATGDIYAFFHAEVGIHVDVWFTSGDFVGMRLDAAAALAGGTPNPSWLAGAIEGNYDVLDGLVSGSCHFEFRVGDGCTPVPTPRENPLVSMGLISELTPTNGQTNVDVFTRPRATFNSTVGRQFDIAELGADGNERIRTFRIDLQNFNLRLRSDNSLVPGSYALATDGISAKFNPLNVLAGRTRYAATVSASSSEYISGSWRAATRLDGTAITESVTNYFTTGNAPDHIPPENVSYSYPFDRQRYFLQAECRNGVIVLKQGQPDLFDTRTTRVGVTTSIVGRFIPADGTGDTITVTPSYYGTTVSFNIPTLRNSAVYAFQVVRKTVDNSMSFSVSLSPVLYRVLTRSYSNGVSLHVSQRRLPGTTVGDGEKLLYVYFFKTSMYNRMVDKIGAWTPLPTTVAPPFGGLELQTPRYTGPELLDAYDMNGVDYETNSGTGHWPPLIRPNGNLRNSTWHLRFTEPWIYGADDRLRRMGLYSLFHYTNFQRYLLDYSWGQGAVLATYRGRPNALVADGEIMPSMLVGVTSATSHIASALMSSGFSGNGFVISPPQVQIDFNQGVIVPLDFYAVQSRASWALSVYGSEFFSVADYNWLRSMVAKRYELMYHTDYTLQFSYSYPGCQDPDTPANLVRKLFSF